MNFFTVTLTTITSAAECDDQFFLQFTVFTPPQIRTGDSGAGSGGAHELENCFFSVQEIG
jgi:hypothetical protein